MNRLETGPHMSRVLEPGVLTSRTQDLPRPGEAISPTLSGPGIHAPTASSPFPACIRTIFLTRLLVVSSSVVAVKPLKGSVAQFQRGVQSGDPFFVWEAVGHFNGMRGDDFPGAHRRRFPPVIPTPNGLVYYYIAWHGDADEIGRHVTPAILIFKIVLPLPVSNAP